MIIDKGTLTRTDKSTADYEITHGRNIKYAFECDRLWGQSNLKLWQAIANMDLDESALDAILEELPLEDDHWRWVNKSNHFASNDFEWFYLHAAGMPQGACVIYHPKPSVLSTGNIFYVEYLASAPWNRSCSLREREFYAVGSTLLCCVLRYAINTLRLSPGFSLHSLPKAQGFYQKLKMVNISQHNKDSLLYFELPKDEAKKLICVA